MENYTKLPTTNLAVQATLAGAAIFRKEDAWRIRIENTELT
jgi:hypothetical protein